MNENIKSVLQINQFVFDELSFKRKGFRQPDADELPLEVETTVRKRGVNDYLVSLTVTVSKENEFDASVRITGYCEIDDDTPNLEIILRENAPAILYPYARAEMTLLTSQPETSPVVLPVINMHEMMRDSKSTTATDSAKAEENLH